jgi:protein gp37
MKRHLPYLRGEGNADVPPTTVLMHPERLDKPFHWRRKRIVLTSMLGDWFHGDVTDEFRDRGFAVMIDTIEHNYYVLTKRPWVAVEYLNSLMEGGRKVCSAADEIRNTVIAGLAVATQLKKGVIPNITLMISTWDQTSTMEAQRAISRLHGGIRWGLHIEPLLGSIDLCSGAEIGYQTVLQRRLPAWVVTGPENGPGARPMDPAWARWLRDQCRGLGIPFWFKGEFDGNRERGRP